MKKVIRKFLLEELGPGFADNQFLVAVSGGRDSMVLLALMARLLPPDKLVVAHWNHALRGRDSDQDEAFVAKAAKILGFPFYSGRGRGEKHSEQSLRSERRSFLLEVAKATQSAFIVTGHHLDDQWETILMRLLRGTGVRGLGGIAPRRGKWLRPLLEISRQQLADYAEREGITFREDLSNQDPKYLRNRVRKSLIPQFLRMNSNHGSGEELRKRVAQTTTQLRWAERELNRKVRVWEKRFVVRTPFWYRFPRPRFLSLTPEWQAFFLHRLWGKLRAPSFSGRTSEKVREMISQGKRHLDAEGGVRVTVSCGEVFVESSSHRAQRSKVGLVRRGTKISIPSLALEIALHDRFGTALEARFFKPGDRYQGKKLKEIFLIHRIPLPERSLTPLLARPNSSEVVWVFPEPHRKISVENEFPFSHDA